MKAKRSNAPGTILEAMALGYSEAGHTISESVDVKQPNKVWRRGTLDLESGSEGSPALEVPFEAVLVCGRPRIRKLGRPKKKARK